MGLREELDDDVEPEDELVPCELVVFVEEQAVSMPADSASTATASPPRRATPRPS
jgi:hypothetical protein